MDWKTVRMRADLHERVSEAASADGRSVAKWLELAAEAVLGGTANADTAAARPVEASAARMPARARPAHLATCKCPVCRPPKREKRTGRS